MRDEHGTLCAHQDPSRPEPLGSAEPGGTTSARLGRLRAPCLNQPECRVLIVEDDSSALALISKLVAAAGWQPVAFPTGEEALQALKKQSFDLAVLDLMLPGVSGMEVLRHIHHHYPDTVMVVLTGYSSLEGAVEAMRQGAFDYLSKPFCNERLIEALRQALDAGRKAREDRKLQEQLRESSIRNRIETEIRQRARELANRNIRLADTDKTSSEKIH